MRRVIGIGGLFFKAQDPAALRGWYEEHLGIDVLEWGGAVIPFTDADGSAMSGTTIWNVTGAASDFVEDPTSTPCRSDDAA